MNEGKLGRTIGALALGAASLMPNAQAANAKEPTAVVDQQSDVEVKEENGKLIIKAFINLKDNTPQSKIAAIRTADAKIQRAAAKYFNKSGSGFVPPFKMEVNDFLSQKTNYVWASWDLN